MEQISPTEEEEQKQFYLDEKVILTNDEKEEMESSSSEKDSVQTVTKTKVVFPSRGDSYPIIGYIWKDEKYLSKLLKEGSSTTNQSQPLRKIVYVVISVATGMHQDYHFLFAQYLVSYGVSHDQPVIVLTYDYRGMGESRDGDKPTIECDFFDWGKDYGGALDFIKLYHDDNYYKQSLKLPMEVCVVGNSIGAYLMMLTPKDVSPMVHRGFMLSAFNGYNGYINLFASRERLKHYLNTRMFFGSVTPLSLLYGYFPSRGFWNAMEDLPTGVAKQWKHFGTLPEYMTDPKTNQVVLPQHVNHTTFLAWVFEDDVFTNQLSTEKFNSKFLYRCKEFHTEVIDRPLMKNTTPSKHLPIGHVGFFSKHTRNFTDLWSDASEFIIFGKLKREATTRRYFPAPDSPSTRSSKL